MSDPGYPYFLETTLDPELLLKTFKVRTNWHVITGAPSSGKTTLINLMKERGFKTSPEQARQYIEMKVSKGQSIEELQADKHAFERAIMFFTMASERELNPKEDLFLDRGLPDCLPYCRVVGLNPNEHLADCFQFHYASIFVLDRLPFQHDGVRYEDDTIADFLHTWTLKDYQSLGYNPIQVPILPPEGRIAFILEKLAEKRMTKQFR